MRGASRIIPTPANDETSLPPVVLRLRCAIVGTRGCLGHAAFFVAALNTLSSPRTKLKTQKSLQSLEPTACKQSIDQVRMRMARSWTHQQKTTPPRRTDRHHASSQWIQEREGRRRHARALTGRNIVAVNRQRTSPSPRENHVQLWTRGVVFWMQPSTMKGIHVLMELSCKLSIEGVGIRGARSVGVMTPKDNCLPTMTSRQCAKGLEEWPSGFRGGPDANTHS